MAIEFKNPILKPQCLKDSHIMEDFIKILFQEEELAELNRLCICLKATCLSDLSTGYGKSISPVLWIIKLNLKNPQYKFTPQPRPRQKAWGNWQADLHFTYNFSISLSLMVHQRLGPQISSTTSTGWI